MTETSRAVQRSPVAPVDCNLARAFEVIGDKWSLMILRSVLYGVVRFDDIQADIGVTKSVLSSRLKRLCDAGFLQKEGYKIKGERARIEYVASPMTHALTIPFIALTQWADHWLDEREGKPVRFRERRDNSDLRVALVNDDKRVVDLRDVFPEFSQTSR
ncbi:helix-turn-helix domain-containing protein [uncultured Roseobacter sp.]|uniref:winged helix-turn-helix transcriptional regulator n=1 Tax=uncultured Roseobacter sp. TaxID=114847 RepID=UPI00260B3A48|nr:helix-turn-helix domain-containing protein [uncultured Roseobacter sp.]